MPRVARPLALSLLLGVPASAGAQSFERFSLALDSLAQTHRLPGYSAAIVRDGAVAWSHGWGFADPERQRRATPETPYRLASVTKPIAATILMQLVHEGRLRLDAPMRDFTIHPWFEPGGGSWAHYPDRYVDGTITVRHVLTHTSQSTPPGEAYRYSGNIFGDLTWVIEDILKESYPRVVQERILDPVGMSRTAAGHLAPWSQAIVRELAVPMAVRGDTVRPGTYPGFGVEPGIDVTPWNLAPAFALPAASDAARRRVLGARYTPLHSAQTAAGMISTVLDLARFDVALDRGRLIPAALRDAMFTPSRRADGAALPYGLGWFVETVGGHRVAWHYGWFPPTVSALYVKLPDLGLTFILLSNSDLLSYGMSWTAEGVRASPFARLFLDEASRLRH
jgi:CubicO group peptidase (beta-lactamase class C family)